MNKMVEANNAGFSSGLACIDDYNGAWNIGFNFFGF
jgi:hypothetical protein